MNEITKTPNSCKHSRFDPIWGEWKCTNYSRRVRNTDCEKCPKYIKTNSKNKLEESK